MNNWKSSRLVFVMLILMGLCACIPGNTTRKEEQETLDLFEVEQLAATAYSEGDWAGSEKYYVILVQQSPEESLSWFRLGNVYARTQRPNAAISAYQEALVRDPKNSKAWYNMAIVQLRQAANSFNELQVFADPDDPLSAQGKKAFDGILELLKQDNEGNDGTGTP